VERRAAQLEAINAIARNTTAIVDLHKLLETICPLLLTNFNVRHVAVYLREGDSLQLSHHCGALSLSMSERELLGPGRGLVNLALERDEVILEQDVSSAQNYVPVFQSTAAELCIPLTFAGEKVGVLALQHDHLAGFVEDELDPLSAVAGICAAAIKNCQHFEEARQLAYRDGLTGIFNRRFFEERIHEELERSDRYSTGVALLMIDIDRFKSLNDEYGHMLGDEVLRQVSRMLAHQTRKTDLVCRYGGEEFAVLLLQLNRERAVEVADKLRRTIEHAQFPGIARLVTVSIGVATVPENGKTRDQIVAAADAALYSAKLGGRNKVMLAEARETELSTSTTT
jgi:diguanylate cyclase (GGDEF)-like protein